LKEYLISINGDCSVEVPSQLEVMHNHVVREKSIYTVINQLQQRESSYIGFLWSPIERQYEIQQKLANFQTTEFSAWTHGRDQHGRHQIPPPTFFKMNDVIAPLQLIVNTYGVPSYQEANPATFAIVTFPFLFAVMFGDYGHGSLLLFMGFCMVMGYDSLKETSMKDVLFLRYLFFMMGFFSCYNGLLYNEWFAIPYPWFKSCYVTDKLPTESQGFVFPYVDFPSGSTTDYDNTHCVYPFGMDPTWFLSSNDILVVQDSLKMKTSVIIGVAHMSMGIVTKGINTIYFGQMMAFWTEVVTGLLILNGLFGWMDMLIIIKWLYPMNPASTDPEMMTRINQAPSIITVMINNLLAFGKQPFVLADGSKTDVYMFPAQRAISEALVVVVLVCMPIMLFTKPCSACFCPVAAGMPEYAKGADVHHAQPAALGAQDPNGGMIDTTAGSQARDDIAFYQRILDSENEDGHHGADMNELFIHQLIETIEFVLGCVSNTASYLRLWALSLAHSQLALVFLQEILQVPWNQISQTSIAGQTVGSFLIWFPFMAVTWAVLMMMDVLECFLHTLRLHWVEFQNKFFKGAGYDYKPFDFQNIFQMQKDRQIA
jgi:V-type H+-transporting ATPase subunit a